MSGPAQGPRLVAVDVDSTPPEAASDPRSTRSRGLLPWLLVAALAIAAVVAAAGWNASAREGARLAGELAVAEQALGEARGRIVVHERHLGVIRHRVDTLLRDFGALDALVSRDPVSAEPAPGE